MHGRIDPPKNKSSQRRTATGIIESKNAIGAAHAKQKTASTAVRFKAFSEL
jgi:hypothetical protein